jgi:hypothetical protein
LIFFLIVQAMELQYIEAETRAKSKYLNNDSKEQAIIEQGIEMQRNVLDLHPKTEFSSFCVIASTITLLYRKLPLLT